MKKLIIITTLAFTLSSCTQLITAPISLAGAAVGATIDVASSAVDAVVPDSKK